MGFICSTTFSLEHLYAQESSDGGAPLPQGLAPEESVQGFQSQGSLSLEPGQPFVTPEEPGQPFVTPEEPGQPFVTPEEPGQPFVTPEEPGQPFVTPEEPGQPFVTPEEPGQPFVTPEEPGQPFVTPGEESNNPNFGPPVVPEPAKRIIDPIKEKFADPERLVEDPFSTINENSPISISPLLIVGIVAVVAIGAGVASFSRHHHRHSSPSPSAQHQVQKEDTREEQIYEDVQIVTQGGIEEV